MSKQSNQPFMSRKFEKVCSVATSDKIPHIFYWESPKANEQFLEQPTDKPKILDL